MSIGYFLLASYFLVKTKKMFEESMKINKESHDILEDTLRLENSASSKIEDIKSVRNELIDSTLNILDHSEDINEAKDLLKKIRES